MTKRLRLLSVVLFLLGTACAGSDNSTDTLVDDSLQDLVPADESGPSTDLDVATDESGTPWIPDGYEIPDTGPDDWNMKDGCLTGRCGADSCEPDCPQYSCGDDGCGGHCLCEQGWTCQAGSLTCAIIEYGNCQGKTCGGDGMGGLCGTCDDPAKPVCGPTGTCGPSTCTFPTTWGKVGVVATLQTPGDAAGVALCPDFSGDGKGDNGLKALASTINPELTKAIPGSIGILFELVGVDDPTADNPGFQLVALIGKPDAADPTKWDVDPASFDPATPSGECRPLIFFDGARIASHQLTAGPSLFSLTVPVASLGGDLSLTFEQTHVVADLTDGTVAATRGILSGILTKNQVDAALAKLQITCAKPNPPSGCTYLATSKSFLPMLFDLDQNQDGKKDAASLCFFFTLQAATIVGLVPAP